jgi:hypothetical protein
MIICPAIVPTTELETPDAGRANAEQRRQRMIGRLDLRDIAVAGMEGARRHHHHGHVDEAGDRERDDDFRIGEAQQLAPLAIVPGGRTVLGQAGM